MNGQHVIVVGGSSGIGLGIARACLARGAAVTVAGRSEARLASASTSLGHPERVRTAAVDVSVEADVRALFAPAPVDHVAITAVHPYYRPVRELDLAEARRTIDSKLIAALHVAKHARFAAGGSLLVTSGIAADRPLVGGAVIAAINGAIESLVRALAIELAPVRVNALSPGWVDTPVWDVLAGGAKAERFAQHAARLPVGRVGAVEDLADAALFLMTNGFATGETLHVDGGHRLV